MKRIDGNVIGVTGLLAWATISASNLLSLRAAGPAVLPFVSTLLAKALYALQALSARPLPLYGCYALAYALSALAFAWSFWSCTSNGTRRTDGNGPVSTGLLIGMQIVIAMLTDTQLTLIVAVELAYVLRPYRAAAWMALQMAAFSALQIARLTGMFGLGPLDLVGAIQEFAMSLTWMVLAFAVGYLAASERRSRIRLGALHADLRSTQHLMMDALRLSERASISRNLHDVLGHHLTALNLHLDLAARQAGDRSTESLRVSQQLAKDLLREVRAVVSLDHERRVLDLRAALQVLADAIPSPRVTLHYDENVAIRRPENAHVVLRCVQEAVTNAIRHAGASLVEVRVHAEAGRLNLHVADDGAGIATLREGNGLRGMRERLQALHGTLELQHGPGRGFTLLASLPAGEL